MGLYLILKWLFENVVFILVVLTTCMILLVGSLPSILYFLVLGPRGVEIYGDMTVPIFEKVLEIGHKILCLTGKYKKYED
jgi:hypothetical protein